MGKFCLEIQTFLAVQNFVPLVLHVVTYVSFFMVVLCETGGLLLQSPFILGYVHQFSKSLVSIYVPLSLYLSFFNLYLLIISNFLFIAWITTLH